MRPLNVLNIFIALFIVIPAPVLCDEQNQTDWSGGYGIPGPVSDWGGTFDSTTTTDWAHNPGEVKLDRALPSNHTTTSDFSQPAGAAVGDFDDDGYDDLAAVAFDGDEVASLRLKQSGQLCKPV